MLNPILAFSATRRMRSFRTMLIVIAYLAVMLALVLVILGPFLSDQVYLSSLGRSPSAYLFLVAVQFGLLILIAPAMTSGSIAGERERQTLDLLLVTNTGSFRIMLGKALESFAVLALFYWMADVMGWYRGMFFFEVVGLNSITIYMAQRLIDFDRANKFLFSGVASLFSTKEASAVVLAAGYVAVVWLFLYFLHRHKVYLKV